MKYQWRVGAVRRRVAAARFLLLAGVFGAAVMAASFHFAVDRASAVVPGNNTRVSMTSGGLQTSNLSNFASLSRDGRFVTFTVNENGMVPSDANYSTDVFVRDLTNNTLTQASVSTSGVNSNLGASSPVISQTGRYVVFMSGSSNLIDGRTITDSNGQLYMRDTVAHTTTLLTEVSPGTYANGNAVPVDVSNDGRFVLFKSRATNLGPMIVAAGYNNLFLLDRSTNAITWVNAAAPGVMNGLDVIGAQMSCDGSFIVFDSSAGYLGLPSSAHTDVFLLDRRGGNKLTNITSSANGAALSGKISCNGNYIGFASYANNLDPITAGMSLDYHAYRYDRINSQFKLLDQSSTGTIPALGVINLPTSPLFLNLSDKGTAVFATPGTGLDPAATGAGGQQTYVRDPENGTTELLSRDSGGMVGNNSSPSQSPGSTLSVSADGKIAAYDSLASNLISGDTNGVLDVYVSDTGL